MRNTDKGRSYLSAKKLFEEVGGRLTHPPLLCLLSFLGEAGSSAQTEGGGGGHPPPPVTLPCYIELDFI